jgi:queuine tRNA-ribosyltransferase
LQPQDLLDVVAAGIDIFDCVAPTRNARHGSLYCGEVVPDGDWLKFESSEDRGRIMIKKAIYAKDERPIHESCTCYTCKNHTRAYLHFLFKSSAALYASLACIHNIHVLHEVCNRMRDLILA